MKRLLAVLAAVAMVAGALYVRGLIDEDDVPREDGTDVEVEGGDGPVRLLCAPEVADACLALGAEVAEVTVEEAGASLDRLTGVSAADPGVDAWVVPAPFPGMLDFAREQDGLGPLFAEFEPLAGTRLAAVVEGARLSQPGCGEAWKCLAEQAGDTATLGWPDPTSSATGLLTVGAVTTGYFERTDYATNDFDAAFRAYLAALVDRARVDRAPVERVIQERALLDVAVGPGATVDALFSAASAGRRNGLTVTYPELVAAVDVVVAGSAPAGVTDALRSDLTAAGWAAPGQSGTVPGAGLAIALRDLL